MKNKKLWYYIGGGVVLLLILLAVAKKQKWIGGDDEVKVSTDIVETRSIIETVSANGKIQPEVEVIVNPDASGEIMEIFVKEGEQVKKGQLLARINPDFYESSLDQIRASLNTQKANEMNAKARYSQVKAQFINTQNTYNRNKKLYDQKVISEAEFETISSQYEVAKAEVLAAEQSIKAAEFTVKSSEAAVKEAATNLTKTNVFAPMDGTISKLSKEVGERVSGASQFSSGTEIMRVARLNSMEVIVQVSENDIVKVKIGDTAKIEVDAYDNRKFDGIVTEIANSAVSTGLNVDQVTNFEVKIRILQESYNDLIDTARPHLSPFRPGMTANVDIQTKKAENVITIPIGAVTTRTDTGNISKIDQIKQRAIKNAEKLPKAADTDESKKAEKAQEFVFIYEKGTAKLVEVEVGIQDNTYFEIKKGLKVGDEVITAPYGVINKDLKNGLKVKKVKKEELYEGDKK